MRCLVCESDIIPFLNLGKQPIANGFLREEDFDTEYFFTLETAFCPNCYMVQLTEQPNRELMFHDNYAFFSSTSKHMASHFERFANDVIKDYEPSFVVELGSNDGIMLKHFASRGIKHLGIEPSVNVADVARMNGIQTISCFFSKSVADEVVQEYGQADIILAANVMAHISDLHSVLEGVNKLLKPDGFLIFEDPYMGDILAKTSYDQIYDEHAYYFSASSIQKLVLQHGMQIIDMSHQDVHGGSMRYTIGKLGKTPNSYNVRKVLINEELRGMDKIETYERFAKAVKKSRADLLDLLSKIKEEGGTIVGYAATAKSATVLNYCGIGHDTIDYISDTTPIKQGKLSPGMHIPVVPYQSFLDNPPTHTILFAWNHANEIMEKEKDYKGKWIVYVPEVKILES